MTHRSEYYFSVKFMYGLSSEEVKGHEINGRCMAENKDEVVDIVSTELVTSMGLSVENILSFEVSVLH